jgi:hypothetical protein
MTEEHFIDADNDVTEQQDIARPGRLIITRKEFLRGFIPPNYIVDGVLQRRFIYSLTGQTGHAKTAIALLIAYLMSSTDPNAMFGTHKVEKGRVIYFVGENADDVRARIIGADALRNDHPQHDRLHFIVGRFAIDALYDQIVLEMQTLGGADLIFIDTSAAYFYGNEEMSNTQMGEHARKLRTLTELPGGPCVVALCHPVKYVTHPSQLLPRGGGAFLAEMDGNLTAWRHDDNLVELHHGDKFRGPGFEPIALKIEKISTPKLVDTKSREIPTVRVVAITEAEEKAQNNRMRADEDCLLLELLTDADRSYADLARACRFFFDDGVTPAKSRVQRTLKRLEQARLVRPDRGGHSALTDQGRKLAKKIKSGGDEEHIDDRGGAHSSKDFFAVVGKRVSKGVPCIRCGECGEVFKIKDGRLRKGQGHAEALHERCAKDWFTGGPSPKAK